MAVYYGKSMGPDARELQHPVMTWTAYIPLSQSKKSFQYSQEEPAAAPFERVERRALLKIWPRFRIILHYAQHNKCIL